MIIEEKENESSENCLTEGSIEALGGAAGGFIGFSATGPLGAAAAGAAGVVATKALIRIYHEVEGRLLSKREKARIETIKDCAIRKFEEKSAKGMIPRRDGFFEDPAINLTACVEIPVGKLPAAEEIYEGILLAAQREHEEKKVQFLANLLVNFAFYPIVDKSMANLLIKLGKAITYRQMCIISIFGRTNEFELRKENYRGLEEIKFTVISLLEEIADLWKQEILTSSAPGLKGMTSINPSKMMLQGMGTLLYELMELQEIDKADIELVVLLLK
jgi:hypothetical protein